jgi:hypothetical protein
MLDSPYRAPGQDFHLRSQRPCQAHLRGRMAAERVAEFPAAGSRVLARLRIASDTSIRDGLELPRSMRAAASCLRQREQSPVQTAVPPRGTQNLVADDDRPANAPNAR